MNESDVLIGVIIKTILSQEWLRTESMKLFTPQSEDHANGEKFMKKEVHIRGYVPNGTLFPLKSTTHRTLFKSSALYRVSFGTQSLSQSHPLIKHARQA